MKRRHISENLYKCMCFSTAAGNDIQTNGQNVDPLCPAAASLLTLPLLASMYIGRHLWGDGCRRKPKALKSVTRADDITVPSRPPWAHTRCHSCFGLFLTCYKVCGFPTLTRPTAWNRDGILHKCSRCLPLDATLWVLWVCATGFLFIFLVCLLLIYLFEKKNVAKNTCIVFTMDSFLLFFCVCVIRSSVWEPKAKDR